MVKTIVLAAILVFAFACGVHAQDAGTRAKELAASLDKEKYKKKDKGSFSIELYIDVKNEAVVKSDKTAYSGLYSSDGNQLNLRVTPSGEASGTGYDSPNPTGGDRKIKFELTDARIDGGLLTGTKVYENGETKKFEAVFVNRTIASGKNKDAIDTRSTTFGIGFIDSGSAAKIDKTGASADSWTNRIFIEKH